MLALSAWGGLERASDVGGAFVRAEALAGWWAGKVVSVLGEGESGRREVK
ncbi:MAG: hypothetical protein N2595_04965 [bacterium]|nr:hypothetical protein [bacterium]